MLQQSSFVPISDWQEITEPFLTRVTPDTLVLKAIFVMDRQNSSCIIVEKNRQLQGIFTARDLVRLIASGREIKGLEIAEVMRKQPPTIAIEENLDLRALITLLEQSATNFWLLTDKKQKPLGLISDRSLRKAFQDRLAQILARDRNQATSHIDLETEIQNRTEELKIANHLLQQQIDARFAYNNSRPHYRDRTKWQWQNRLQTKIANLLNQFNTIRLPVWTGGASIIILILAIEFFCHFGIVFPVPFLPIIAIVILSASLSGIRAGSIGVAICCFYLIYTASTSHLHSSVTAIAGIVHLSLSIAMVVAIGLIQGWAKEENRRLTAILRFTNSNLDREVKQRTEELSKSNISLKNEISDRIMAEIKLKKSEAKYRAIFEQAAVGIVSTGIDKQLIEVNPKFSQFLGYDIPTLQKLTCDDITHPEDRPLDKIQLRQLFLGEISTLVKEKRYIHQDGSIVWGNLTTNVVRDLNQQPAYLVNIIEDINDRKQAELALQESEARFFNMVNSFPFPVWISDETGICNFFNQAWLDFTGKSLEQESGYGRSKRIHPDDLQQYIDSYQSAFAKQASFVTEFRLQRFDGEYCWFLDRGQPRFRDDGSFAGYIGACIDISDRINAKIEREKFLQQIAEKNQFLESVLQQMPVGVIIANAPNGNILMTNQRVETVLRHPLIPIAKIADYARYGCLNANGKPRTAQDYTIVKALQQGQTIIGEETQYLCGDGEIRPILINAAPIFNRESQIVAAVATFYDITELKQAREIKKDAANKALLLKEIHHRIKNNLQIISSLLDLQSLKTKIPETRKVLEESQARIQTIALIHEKLYISENLDSIKLSDYIQSLISYLHKSFISENQEIQIIADIEPIFIDLDRAIYCGLIVNELVVNALKHGFLAREKGTIDICLSQKEPGLIGLVVRDNGIGIREKFDLANMESLGLSLVNSLVEIQLEGIWEVQKMNGTIFRIEFTIK